MKQVLAKWLLKMFGWTGDPKKPDIKKYVAITAPHTSMWDFVLGKMYCLSIGLKSRILIKKESFFFPLGILLRSLGGIPVNRSKNMGLEQQLIQLFEQHDEFVVSITPEGTRKKVKRWKRGYYKIAMHANVPVVLTYIDYKERKMGFGPVFYPSGDYSKDFELIKKFYQDKTGKHPEKFCVIN